MWVQGSVGLRSRFAFRANFLRMGVFTVAFTSPVVHADALRVGLGYGQGIELYGISIQLDRKSPLHEYEVWTLTSHVDLGIGEFRAHHSDSSTVPPERWQLSPSFVGNDVKRGWSSPLLRSGLG